jgi:tetratricopeptide (TPR) repeat protein
MGQIEKTVFISYRRTNAPWALAVSQNLSYHGYDVFFDFSEIGSGDFERVILSNIHARAHFVVLLTPSALHRCDEAGDWLRREIETALAAKRNVVPLLLEGFHFNTPEIADKLTGSMAALKKYNAIRVPVDYFDEAMDRLQRQFLSIPLETVLHPLSMAVQEATEEQQRAAGAQPAVEKQELTALEYFEHGFKTTSLDEKVRFYTEAIRLKPDYAEAINYRGLAREKQGDRVGAQADYDQAIQLKPGYVSALNNRARMHLAQDDLPNAQQDYDAAIRVKPESHKDLIDMANYGASFDGRAYTRALSRDVRSLEDLEQSQALAKAMLQELDASAQRRSESAIGFQEQMRSYLRSLKQSASLGDASAAEMIPQIERLIDTRYDDVRTQRRNSSKWRHSRKSLLQRLFGK